MKYEILFLLLIVMLCYFETLLSSRQNKYLGLILPILTFVGTFGWTITLVNEFDIVKLLVTLIFVNIPTYILLLIYYFGRRKLKKKKK